jgi:hypothetical protein
VSVFVDKFVVVILVVVFNMTFKAGVNVVVEYVNVVRGLVSYSISCC